MAIRRSNFFYYLFRASSSFPWIFFFFVNLCLCTKFLFQLIHTVIFYSSNNGTTEENMHINFTWRHQTHLSYPSKEIFVYIYFYIENFCIFTFIIVHENVLGTMKVSSGNVMAETFMEWEFFLTLGFFFVFLLFWVLWINWLWGSFINDGH